MYTGQQYLDNETALNDASFGNRPCRASLFAGTGVIKLACEKISVLIQATLSNLEIAPQGPPQLNLDVDRIFTVGQRVANFLLEIVAHKDMQPPVDAERFAQIVDIVQSFKTRVWHDTDHVGRQLKGVGRVGSNHLVTAKLTTYARIINSSPSALEMAMSRAAPYGSGLLKDIRT